MQRAAFAGEGAVWATTTSYISPRHERAVPYTLTYVDLDGGPRLLAHIDDAAAAAVGVRVRLAGTTGDGDPLVEPAP
jgi:uncharacterized OB-fold protein